MTLGSPPHPLEPLLRRTFLPAAAFSSSRILQQGGLGKTIQNCERISSGHFYRKSEKLTQEIGSLGNGRMIKQETRLLTVPELVGF